MNGDEVDGRADAAFFQFDDELVSIDCECLLQHTHNVEVPRVSPAFAFDGQHKLRELSEAPVEPARSTFGAAGTRLAAELRVSERRLEVDIV